MDQVSEAADTMAAAGSSPSGAMNAVGTILGYIGAEAATTAVFKRLLWPQRAYFNLQLRHIPQLALLQPGGGPLYKAALEVLDTAFKYGLFRGRQQGHTLGTAFFPDSDTEYMLHDEHGLSKHSTEASRNNIWARVMALVPFTAVRAEGNDIEKTPGSAKSPLRTRVAVRHLKLSINKVDRTTGNVYLEVDSEGKAFSLRSVFGVIVEEVLGLTVAAVVALVWRSWFAVLWIAPLALKLLSVATALRRDALDLALKGLVGAQQADFIVDMAPETSTFLIITGPPALVLQFFRHYGHPKRDRVREVLQLGIIVLSALLFPLGLLCSVAWMSLPVQYTWLSYQMYVVGAMYISRFMNVDLLASTEEGIARALTANEKNGPVNLWIDRTNGRVVEALLESTFFSRYGQGQEHVRTLLSRSGDSARSDTPQSVEG